jgi:hypothetical protein
LKKSRKAVTPSEARPDTHQKHGCFRRRGFQSPRRCRPQRREEAARIGIALTGIASENLILVQGFSWCGPLTITQADKHGRMSSFESGSHRGAGRTGG